MFPDARVLWRLGQQGWCVVDGGWDGDGDGDGNILLGGLLLLINYGLDLYRSGD